MIRRHPKRLILMLNEIEKLDQEDLEPKAGETTGNVEEEKTTETIKETPVKAEEEKAEEPVAEEAKAAEVETPKAKVEKAEEPAKEVQAVLPIWLHGHADFSTKRLGCRNDGECLREGAAFLRDYRCHS